MLKIKLAPFGKKHQRHYRLVVTQDRQKLTGHHLEILGHYHPLLSKSDSSRLVIHQAKVDHWLKQGAVPTDRIRRLLARMPAVKVKAKA
jgi:small subunit ribosomal protein S16